MTEVLKGLSYREISGSSLKSQWSHHQGAGASAGSRAVAGGHQASLQCVLPRPACSYAAQGLTGRQVADSRKPAARPLCAPAMWAEAPAQLQHLRTHILSEGTPKHSGCFLHACWAHRWAMTTSQIVIPS